MAQSCSAVKLLVIFLSEFSPDSDEEIPQRPFSRRFFLGINSRRSKFEIGKFKRLVERGEETFHEKVKGIRKKGGKVRSEDEAGESNASGK